MKKYLLLVVGLALSPNVWSSQEKPVIVVQVFTAASDVVWPYDMKQMQAQIVAEPPSTPASKVYILATEITAWHPGNAAKRLLVGWVQVASLPIFSTD